MLPSSTTIVFMAQTSDHSKLLKNGRLNSARLGLVRPFFWPSIARCPFFYENGKPLGSSTTFVFMDTTSNHSNLLINGRLKVGSILAQF